MKPLALIMTVLLLVGAINDAAASKSDDIKAGNRSYEKGDYAGAVSRYEQVLKQNPESDVANFNAGTARYKKGDYPQAIDHLQKSLLTDNDELREKTHYNLGNSFLKAGLAKEAQDIDSAVSSVEQSLGQYESALKLKADDQDAQYNYEIAKKELERLKKQKEQQKKKPSSQPKDQPKNDQQNKDQEKQKDQRQSGSDGQQQKNPDQQGGTPQDHRPEQKEHDDKQEDKDQSGQKKDASSESPPDSENKEKSSGISSGSDRIENPPETSAGEKDGPVAEGEMSKKEAEQLLNSYQQREEPKGLLNFQGKRRESPVIKDW